MPDFKAMRADSINLSDDHSLAFETVDKLIDQETAMWTSSIVNHIFDNSCAQEILRIPINKQLLNDQLIWQPEPSGFFSVKSAYSIDQRRRLQCRGTFTEKQWH